MKKSNSKPLPSTKGLQLDGKDIFTPYKPKTNKSGNRKEKK